MATGPFQVMRQIRVDQDSSGLPLGQPVRWRVELELQDTADVSRQKDCLAIRTIVAGPLPGHPQAVLLGALQHARDLLTAQIEAMQSP